MPEESILQPASAVGPNESLARYLTSQRHYNLQTRSVRPSAFEPPSDLRLSVFRIDGLSIEQVWENGLVNVIGAMTQTRTLYGMGKIKASAVRDVHLDIDADDIPPRHACLIGWPEEKYRRMSIAQELAASARLILRS